MPCNLRPGSYRIISLAEGRPPTSVNFTRPAFQFVGLQEPVQVWSLTPAGDDGVYHLAIIGYPFTGVMEDKVTATIDPEVNMTWHFTYRENHDAYTIEPASDHSVGWTVPEHHSIGSKVEIKPIISTKSFPPQFLPPQLFVLQHEGM